MVCLMLVVDCLLNKKYIKKENEGCGWFFVWCGVCEEKEEGGFVGRNDL